MTMLYSSTVVFNGLCCQHTMVHIPGRLGWKLSIILVEQKVITDWLAGRGGGGREGRGGGRGERGGVEVLSTPYS